MSLKPWNRPRHYFGESWDGWLVGSIGQSRDSDTVEESNFRTVLRRLKEVDDADTAAFIAAGGDERDEMCCGHCVVTERHFLCGWVQWIAIPPHAAKSIAVWEEADRKLEDYPILDDEDHSMLEHERNPPDEEEVDDESDE